jgi:hypothetical protein
MNKPALEQLKRLDLVFCIDVTGSMGGLIASARRHVGKVLDALKKRVALRKLLFIAAFFVMLGFSLVPLCLFHLCLDIHNIL